MTVSISQRVSPSVKDTADLAVGSHFTAGLPRDDAAWLSITDRGGAAVVSLRGELDISGASVLQAYLSDIRRQLRARSVADLTGLAFIDCACLNVLVRHCKEVRRQGGSLCWLDHSLACAGSLPSQAC